MLHTAERCSEIVRESRIVRLPDDDIVTLVADLMGSWYYRLEVMTETLANGPFHNMAAALRAAQEESQYVRDSFVKALDKPLFMQHIGIDL